MHPLSASITLEELHEENERIALLPADPPPVPDLLQVPVKAEAYVWSTASIDLLEPSLWSYGDFVRESAWKWIDGPIEHYKEPIHAAFFYGTLMHPMILRRVINNSGNHLKICPAVLLVSDSLAYKSFPRTHNLS